MSGTANDFPARTNLLLTDFFWTKRGNAVGAEGLTPAEVVLNEVAGLETQQS
jgi:hypothetical protein